MSAFITRDLGRVPYQEALNVQHATHARVADGVQPPTLLLVEHDPVITHGRKDGEFDFEVAPRETLAGLGIEVVHVERGGSVTYHGPGQIVGYPIFPVGRRVRDFLADTKPGQPWFFWLGFHEPHREYEQDSYKRFGKKASDVDHVPAYWPDNATIRGDMLDYAVEVEHCDQHLGRILAELEKRGELDRTLIIITSDNGMPFPRVKGSSYEDANHLPLAIRWPAGIRNSGRKVTDYVNFVDFAPTFLDVAGVAWPTTGNLGATSGRSLTDIFQSGVDGRSNPARDHTLIGRERNDLGRPGDVGYPIRGIVKDGLAYLENCEPSRWPACNPETGYLDTDASPTKTFLLEARRAKGSDSYWDFCFGMRPGRELYDLAADRDCVRNLAVSREADVNRLRDQMWVELKNQGDLRAAGRGAEFEAFPSADVKKRGFYERYTKGELLDAPWVNKTDFEKEPLK